MDCGKVRELLQEEIDGRLPSGEAERVRAHVETCPSCAAEARSYRLLGERLRGWTAAAESENAPRMDAMWTRVRAGIEERRGRERLLRLAKRWSWLPAVVALSCLALLFYHSGVNRTPFNPKSFDVAVEDLESDTATLAFVDKGDELPRVIWIIENDKT